MRHCLAREGLTLADSLRDDTAAMLRGGTPDDAALLQHAADGTLVYCSLRDPDNYPRASFMYAPARGELPAAIAEVRCRQNAPPTGAVLDHLHAWAEEIPGGCELWMESHTVAADDEWWENPGDPPPADADNGLAELAADPRWGPIVGGLLRG